MGNSGFRKMFYPGDLVETRFKNFYEIKCKLTFLILRYILFSFGFIKKRIRIFKS